MKRRGNWVVRLAFGLGGLGACGLRPADAAATAAEAPAATEAPVAAGAATLAVAPAAAEGFTAADAPAATEAPRLAAAPVYHDRYFAPDSAAPDISRDVDGTADQGGLARSLQIDGVVSALESHGAGTSADAVENGFVGKAQWDTATLGAWSLDAAARTGSSGDNQSEQGQGGVLTLRQRDLPFDGGWRADNALGDLNPPEIELAKLQPRFYLPTGPMQGATTDWHGPDLELAAGGGVPGIFDGIVVPNFHTLDGSTATAGAEWTPAPHWAVGGQFIEAHDVNLAVGPLVDGNSLLSSNTGLVSAAWHDQGDRLQVNLLDDEVAGKGNGVGGWVDGAVTQGHVQQSAGLFRIEPNATWGNQLIPNDMQGGYYRFDYQSRQWLADLGLDEVHSISGLTSDTTFATADMRYQLSRDWAVGAVTDLSRADGTNWSLEGFVDHPNRWGTGRVQADAAHTSGGEDSTLTVDQSWTRLDGLRLSTSASVERLNGVVYDGVRADSTLLGVNVFGGGQFTARLGAEGNLRWLEAVQGRSPPGAAINVSVTCDLAPHWQLLATYYDSRSGSWTPPTVQSPLTPAPAATLPASDERGIFLTLRYKRASGLHFAPLGGGPGGASGEIGGSVYLDANGNGRIDAGEAGAPNVTVVLDGRFSVQTDAAGRFYFPAVATGHHFISVISDNLPLPWTLIGEGRAEVDVTTRNRTEVDVAAQRYR